MVAFNGNGNSNGNEHPSGHGAAKARDAAFGALEHQWATSARWQGIIRPYSAADVYRLRGSITIEHTLASLGAQRLWELLHTQPYVHALGALTGNQAIQQVRAGLQAIYLSGWQVAADANGSGHMYPDQSLYPCDSVPRIVRNINRALARADQIAHAEGMESGTHWFAPIVADAEAGFGGALNAFELMKEMIDAGAAGVHFEDQLSSAKKCGHMGGKVLVPTCEVHSEAGGRATGGGRLRRADRSRRAHGRERRVPPHRRRRSRADQPFLTGARTTEGLLPLPRRARLRHRARPRVRAVRGPALVRDV